MGKYEKPQRNDVNSTERSDILVFNCYLCHVSFLLTCYVCSTKIGGISDISKYFENFVSQALGVLTRIYAAELRLCIFPIFIMKFVLSILCLLLTYGVYSQNVTHIKGRKYEGYSFPKEFYLEGFPPASNRYTLSDTDIYRAEEILLKNIPYLITPCSSHKVKLRKVRLHKYYRQYVGYIDGNEQILVHINFISKDTITSIKELSEDLIMIVDGGGSYWEMIINITTGKVISIKQNGYG